MWLSVLTAGVKGAPGSALATLQAEREQDRLANSVRKRRRVDGALPPTGANPREAKALSGTTIATLQLAIDTREGGHTPTRLSQLAADLLLGTTQPSTANQYAALIRRLHSWCAEQGVAGNPPSVSTFVAFVAEYCKDHTSSSGVRAVFAAMNFFASLAGYPSPAADPLAVRAKEAASRRLGSQGIPKAALFAAELVPTSALLGGTLSFRDQHTQTHIQVLQAANGRFDDLFRSNLGDLVFIPLDRIDIVIFGTKTDKSRKGLVATIPYSALPSSAYGQLVNLLARGATRLAALSVQIQQPLIDSFTQSVRAGAQEIPETIPLFPSSCVEPLLAIRSSLGIPLPVHALPLFGEWLSADSLNERSDLSQRAAYKPLLRAVKLLAAPAGLSPSDVGCHSLRRGGATELQAAGASPAQMLLALRHKSPASTLLYASPAAAAAALAALARGNGPA